MQKLLALILMLALTGQTFSQGFFYLDYAIDRASYVKNCVNKARPMLHCNGKCQLMKKIQEQEKKQQRQAPEMKFAAKAELIFSRSFFTSYSPVFVETSFLTFHLQNSGTPVDRPKAHFHPPCIC